MFLAVVSYVLGIFMETFIPRHRCLRWLNPVNHLSYPDSSIDSEYLSTGAIQQERECLRYHHGQCSSELRPWYRSPRSPAFVLQHHS
jgi:hypothetical protein